MLLNRLKILQTYQSADASSPLANHGRVWYFSTADTSAYGEIGNINKPFGSAFLTFVVNGLSSADDCFIFLPGIYNVFSFIIPKKNQRFILVDATLNCSGYNGNIVCLNNSVSDRAENVVFEGLGNSSINKTSTNNDWAFLAPYFYCKMDFKNITISSPGFMENMFGNTAHLVRFYNCTINFTDNRLTVPSGDYWTAGSVEYHNCRVSGLTAIGNGGSDYGYVLKAYRTVFTAIINPSGTIHSNVSLMDNSAGVGKDVFFEDCDFISNNENIISRTIDLLYSPLRNIVITRCNFVNASGWINNQIDNQPFKLTTDSYSSNNASGFPVVNLYPGSGVQIIPNIQL